ncbi:MAG: hypothetical protein AAFU64_14545 [Bacteroidota bacterium]
MDNPIDDLKEMWQKSKANPPRNLPSTQELIDQAQQKKRQSIVLQFTAIMVLSGTLLVLIIFFNWFAPLKNGLSLLGKGLMQAVLLIRILVEVYSIYRAQRIEIVTNAYKSNQEQLAYYQYRKKLHGSFTIGLLAIYSLGFLMLGPEFSWHFNTLGMLLIYGSYLPAALITTYFIRKGIRDEMKVQKELLRIQQELEEKKY